MSCAALSRSRHVADAAVPHILAARVAARDGSRATCYVPSGTPGRCLGWSCGRGCCWLEPWFATAIAVCEPGPSCQHARTAHPTPLSPIIRSHGIKKTTCETSWVSRAPSKAGIVTRFDTGGDATGTEMCLFREHAPRLDMRSSMQRQS